MNRKISLINIDSTIPNIPLLKLEKYYQHQGCEVKWNSFKYDEYFISCIFEKNKKILEYWKDKKNVTIGGTGYDFKVKLPQDIEDIKLKINMGYTTRGCIRKCGFCVAWKKEGKSRVVGDIYDFWDRISREIVMLDNNLAALPHQLLKIFNQIKKHNLKVDFNQGLDIRLMTNIVAKLLSELQLIEGTRYRFAWDSMDYKKIFLKNINIIKKHIKPSRIMIYILCGYDTDFIEDYYRVMKVKKLGCDSFVMKYHKNSDLLNEFARWNNRFYFRSLKFKDYLKIRNNSHLLKKSEQINMKIDRT